MRVIRRIKHFFALTVAVVLVFISYKKIYFNKIFLKTRYLNVFEHRTKSQFYKLETSNFIQSGSISKEKCWEKIYDANINIVSSPQTALCLFKPLKVKEKNEYIKSIVVLGVGCHVGPAADNKEILPKAGYKYISWQIRDKKFNELKSKLVHGYSKEHLKLTQELFWKAYKNDSELIEADIIVCGFDAWHCLIFAPFNKKIVLNSSYRFDGHIATSFNEMAQLQKELYDAVRYNPDVIMAGSIIYDVMYQQHYLGSHKIIPLPASCEYVQNQVKKDIRDKKNCFNKCKKANNKTLVMIFPKRLSNGGRIVADEIIREAEKMERTFEIKNFQQCFPNGYNYCHMEQLEVGIMLGYSVMSYFNCEVANIGVPLFVPSPKLYANYEKQYHLVEERKQRIQHTSYDAMRQSNRSLNYGYNPNDDFNETALQRWLSYSDYYYYGGVEQFDSYEELFRKITTVNLTNLKQKAHKHRIENNKIVVDHWQAIMKYFYGDSDYYHEKPYTPSTLNDGLEMWRKSVSRPSLTSTGEKNFDGLPVITIMLEDLNEVIPECFKYKNEFIIVLLTNRTETINGCKLINYVALLDELNWFDNKHFPKSIQWETVAMIMYAITLRPSRIITFTKTQCISNYCFISDEFDFLQLKSTWKMSVYESTQFWYMFAPEDFQIFDNWIKTLASYTSELHSVSKCRTCFQTNKIIFSEEEIEYLSSYLHYWKSDETESFFHVIDQLNFELAVRGYLSKLHAKLHRWLLQKLVQLGYSKLPLIVN
ncbi:uncharacterized protein LOC124815537 isoform X1 [Hydra vulgaris]|uniref:uncharacterized protein LOC124815537 isoform X1 n=1 Tax=Hydra vulgaris TaxID=6087 RepID=UPI001F5F0A75|nr:uncharacterized protein LOC124815537 [Hydra vulgaris]